ncbi:MAG: serine/threonine protein kinase [Polyangiaceae bacterium]|nr:serine/threonine protein kinase [Polyangiaceae bacterium]
MSEDPFRLIGTVLAGVFQVQSVIGEGGFAVVYRAHHTGFRAPVALKCLKMPEGLSEEAKLKFRAQFQGEAEMLFKLSASISTVVRPLHIDSVVAPNGAFMPFIALEWLEGENLDEMFERRNARQLPQLSLEGVVHMLGPVANALARAHRFPTAEGPVAIVHRDIKPENIFMATVAGEQVVKILDFGIAKAKSVASQAIGHVSQSQDLNSFTPAYGSPEQWVPKRYGQTGPWTDVWGLALTIVELSIGRSVMEGDQGAIMGTVLDPQRRPSPRTEGLQVTDAVEAVFLKGLAVDPRERYSDVGVFWRDLRAALSATPSGQPGPVASAKDWVDATVPGQALQAQVKPSQVSQAAMGQHNLLADEEETAGGIELDVPESDQAKTRGAAGNAGHGKPDVSNEAAGAAARGAFAAGLSAGRSPPEGVPPQNYAPVVAPAEAPLELKNPSFPDQSPLPHFSSHPGASAGTRPSPALEADARRGTYDSGFERERGTFLVRFMVPIACVVGGIALALIDQAYARSAGGRTLSLGIIKLSWLAIPLVLGGISLGIVRIVKRD